MTKKIKIIVILLIFCDLVHAQIVDSLENSRPIDYKSFMESVGKNNLEYAAEKFNIDIAKANILTSRIFPDPELEIGYADNGERRMQMGYSFNSELNWTLELGGKRKARINLAESEAQLTNSLLELYYKNLRADATLAYLQAMLNRHIWKSQVNSLEQLSKLASADSIRYQLGAISQVDSRQAKLEAGTMRNEIYSSLAESKISLAQLSLLMGIQQHDVLYNPTEILKTYNRDFKLEELIKTAQNNRTDLQIALQNKAISSNMLKLAKANRSVDLGLSLGVEYNSYAHNEIAPTPAFTKIGGGLSIPLKFSNRRSGEVKVAEYSVLQTNQEYKAVEIAIQTEIVQAFYKYEATQKQVGLFNTGLLTEAEAILTGKTYSYQRGETSLLEVLDAQRTYNEVQLNYYQTLYNQAEALVELERAVGIWDITL